MPRQLNTILAILITMLLVSATQSSGAWPWQDNTLVTIDGENYSTDDFRSWWTNWQEKDQPLPETPAPYIDWILQYREAERMRLFEDPAFQRKVQTFLKARTLMLLKNEEVDAKVKVRDSDIRARYEKLYVPLYQVTILSFSDQEAADSLLARIGTDAVDETLLKNLANDPTNRLQLKKQWLRPSSFSPENLAAVQQLTPGRLSPPLQGRRGVVMLFLHATSDGDNKDYESVKKVIYQYLRKQRAGELTAELLQKLRRKYEVTVDEERLQAIDIDAPLESFTDAPLITTTNGDISEKLFMAQLLKQKRFNTRNNFAVTDAMVFKQRVLNGIIDQTLTTWEGLARGYENKPPLKESYLFYSRHRMIKRLESRVLKVATETTPEEIEQYYREHIREFTTPEIIRMSILDGDKKAMQVIWTEVAMGGDFRQLTAKLFGHAPPVRDVPVNHLEPEVLAMVNSLDKGELSPVFSVNGHTSLLLLVDRKPARTMPLSKVSKQIREQIAQQRAENKRQEFLIRLRGQSTIEINDAVWQRLKEDMQETEKKDDQA